MSPFELAGETAIPRFQHGGFGQIWTSVSDFNHLGTLAPCPEDSSRGWILLTSVRISSWGLDLAQTGQALKVGQYYDMQSKAK